MLFAGSEILHLRIFWRDEVAMQNDLRYQVRSREIVDLVSAMGQVALPCLRIFSVISFGGIRTSGTL